MIRQGYHLNNNGRPACGAMYKRSHDPFLGWEPPKLTTDTELVWCLRCQKTRAFHSAVLRAIPPAKDGHCEELIGIGRHGWRRCKNKLWRAPYGIEIDEEEHDGLCSLHSAMSWAQQVEDFPELDPDADETPGWR